MSLVHILIYSCQPYQRSSLRDELQQKCRENVWQRTILVLSCDYRLHNIGLNQNCIASSETSCTVYITAPDFSDLIGIISWRLLFMKFSVMFSLTTDINSYHISGQKNNIIFASKYTLQVVTRIDEAIATILTHICTCVCFS